MALIQLSRGLIIGGVGSCYGKLPARTGRQVVRRVTALTAWAIDCWPLVFQHVFVLASSPEHLMEKMR